MVEDSLLKRDDVRKRLFFMSFVLKGQLKYLKYSEYIGVKDFICFHH